MNINGLLFGSFYTQQSKLILMRLHKVKKTIFDKLLDYVSLFIIQSTVEFTTFFQYILLYNYFFTKFSITNC